MCPHLESNLRPFGINGMTLQPIELDQLGQRVRSFHFLSIISKTRKIKRKAFKKTLDESEDKCRGSGSAIDSDDDRNQFRKNTF